ncbi:MAG: IS110 family transposase [Candidatus Accumulibacter sp.]|jgi:transposase|nr:IS110 family transposase [Accumulibacter sp.]
MKLTRIGLDLAKNVFQVHGVDQSGHVALRRRLSRNQMVGFFKKLTPCLIGMEACASAHHWGRVLQEIGHTVRLIAPQFVKPYVKGQKNDANDAEGICEALSRPSMRFVAIKRVEQQDIQSIHRIRSERVKQRTATVNQIRGLLGEYGIVVPKGINQLRRALPEIAEDMENGLTEAFRNLLEDLRRDLAHLDERVKQLEKEIQKVARKDEAAKRLQTIPGIGPITATALAADLGDARHFKRGREVSAFLGLTPRQHSSGGKAKLSGISKRGDTYLRTLLIHGARAALRTAGNKTDPRSRWVIRVSERRHRNIAAVALANKNARIAWALLSRGETFDPHHIQRPTEGTGRIETHPV